KTGQRRSPQGRLEVSCDRAVDLETVPPVALAKLAEKHAAPSAFEPDGVEAAALQRQHFADAKLGDLAEAHRKLLQDCGHRQPRLFDSRFHGKRPAAVGPLRLDRLPL